MKIAEERIAQARSFLVMDHPFFGTLTLNMDYEVVDEDHPMAAQVRTAGTNGKKVWYNRAFVDGMTDSELLFLTAHESSHPLLHHLTRKGARDHGRWNRAGDYLINGMLIEDGIGTLPAGGLHDPQLVDAGGGTTEGVYELLESEGESGGAGEDGEGGGGGDPAPWDDLITDGVATEAEASELEAQWRVLAAQAARSAKMQGRLSANLERFVESILNPKVDWARVLMDFVVKCRDDNRTWARPNRRWVSQGLYLPSMTGEAMGPLVVAIDTSGSVGPTALDQFAAELRAIQEDIPPSELHVVYFDSQVCGHEMFAPDEPVRLTPKGGGGTMFSPIFRFVAEQDIEPVACVVLTDLCCNDFGPAPDYPTLWVTTDPGTAPWGQVVEM